MNFAQLRQLLSSELNTKLFKYLFVGAIAALTDLGLFAFLVYFTEWHYILSATLSFITATLVNYLLCITFVFQSGRHAAHLEITYVYLASFVGLAINNTTLFILYEWVGFHVVIAKILATGTTFFWNFSARYLWIFERPKQQDNSTQLDPFK